jgi:putative AdoMet-dependent methyltransferase
MSTEDRSQLFDDWAGDYDRSVRSADGFPFDGYERVLDEIVELAAAQPHMHVLDLGTGTGNLAKRFVALGCTVLWIDFSSEMLAEARIKAPQAIFVQADLLGDWPAPLNQRFDRIVSAYVFHEFDLLTKISLLQRLARHHLVNSGRIVIGDIAFPTVGIREEAHRRWVNLWDEDEHYWAADEVIAASERVGLQLRYTQVSSCGGVLVIEPVRAETRAT